MLWEGFDALFFTLTLLREAGEIWFLGCLRHLSCSGCRLEERGVEEVCVREVFAALRGLECFALSLSCSWVSLFQQCCDPAGGEDLAEQGRGANVQKGFRVSGFGAVLTRGAGLPSPL